MNSTPLGNVSCLIWGETRLHWVGFGCTLCGLVPERTWPTGDTFTNIIIEVLGLSVSVLQLLLGNRIADAIHCS
jgi:hypothetical protein